MIIKTMRQYMATCVTACLLFAAPLQITSWAAIPVSLEVSAVNRVSGTGRADEFTFVLSGIDDAPVPADSILNQKNVIITGAGDVDFGSIEYSSVGEYHYQIEEIAGNNPDYSYDTDIYDMTVYVVWMDERFDSLTVQTVLVNRGDTTKSAEAIFENIYKNDTSGGGDSGGSGSGSGGAGGNHTDSGSVPNPGGTSQGLPPDASDTPNHVHSLLLLFNDTAAEGIKNIADRLLPVTGDGTRDYRILWIPTIASLLGICIIVHNRKKPEDEES